MNEEILLSRLSAAIKQVRREENISVADLAEKMGCSPSYIRMVEAKRQGISLKKLGELAAALGREINITFPKKD